MYVLRPSYFFILGVFFPTRLPLSNTHTPGAKFKSQCPQSDSIPWQAHILKSADGRSKGCGIVLYQKLHEVARAISKLQNSELHGRPILICEVRK